MTQQAAMEPLLESAYELFLQQAAHHLPPEDIVDITLEFEERGAVESMEPDGSWAHELGGPFDASQWVEIWVGLLDHQQEFAVIYARMLLSLATGETCHIRWKSKSV